MSPECDPAVDLARGAAGRALEVGEIDLSYGVIYLSREVQIRPMIAPLFGHAHRSDQEENIRMPRGFSAAAIGLAALHGKPLRRDRSSRPTATRRSRSTSASRDLLARMTLEEKVAQLQGLWKRNAEDAGRRGHASIRPAPARCSATASASWRGPARSPDPPPGRHVRSARQHAEFVNAVQKWLIENTRLGIPVMFHEEALHGLVAPQAARTSPCRSRLASTWDPGARRAGR